jgi:hypothetical protein
MTATCAIIIPGTGLITDDERFLDWARNDNSEKQKQPSLSSSTTHGSLSLLAQSRDEVVVLLVCADPEPDDEIAITTC